MMRILIPLDGSPLAEQAVPQSLAFARDPGAVIMLAKVVQPNYYTDLGLGYGAADILRADREAAEKTTRAYLEGVIRRYATPGLVMRPVALEGDPAAALSAYAQDTGVDLIVLTSHARTGIARMIIGSVAERVARESRVPTLILRPDQPPLAQSQRDEPFTILAPLDGSALSEAILEASLPLARATQGAVRLLRVVPPLAGPSLVDKMLAHEVERDLVEWQARLEAQGIVTYHAIAWGDPVDRIVAAAQEYQTDLIAVATHGRAGFDHLMHGSVMLEILHRTNAPVLAFHPPATHPCWQAHPFAAWDAP